MEGKELKLKLTRYASIADCTLGQLYVDDELQCVTCEDVVRERPGVAVKEWKVQGETAIPQGTYKIIINYSPHFNRELPLLVNVPGFVGVRIHPGNTAADTEGCILVGQKTGAHSVLESRVAFADLFEKIEWAIAAGEPCEIEVLNRQ